MARSIAPSQAGRTMARMNQRASTIRPVSSRISGLARGERPIAADSSAVVPILLVSRKVACDRVVDARARFVLAFIDDQTPIFELLQTTGLPVDETADVLVALYEDGLVGFARPANEST